MNNRDGAKPRQDPAMTPESGQDSPATRPRSGPVLEPDLQAHIGRQLRAVFDEVVNEQVPERFLKLLAELERKQGGKS